jgi:hypothetical protein
VCLSPACETMQLSVFCWAKGILVIGLAIYFLLFYHTK